MKLSTNAQLLLQNKFVYNIIELMLAQQSYNERKRKPFEELI